MQNAKRAVVVVTSDVHFTKKIENSCPDSELITFATFEQMQKSLEKLAENRKICNVVIVDHHFDEFRTRDKLFRSLFDASEVALADAIWIFMVSPPVTTEKYTSEITKNVETGAEGRWLCVSSAISAPELAQLVRFASANAEKNNRFAVLKRVTGTVRGLGHEFGNILFKAGGRAELITMETDPDRIKTHAEALLTAVERGGRVVSRLHLLPKQGLALVSTHLSEVMDEAIDVVMRDMGSALIEVERDFETLAALRLDPRAVGQAFQELLSNAILAMPNGGRLLVSVKKEGRHALVRVEDTGCGMSNEVLSRIFDWGYHTRGEKGGGIGLSLAREIVEALGGHIEVRTAPGQGSTFSVYFPYIPVA